MSCCFVCETPRPAAMACAAQRNRADNQRQILFRHFAWIERCTPTVKLISAPNIFQFPPEMGQTCRAIGTGVEHPSPTEVGMADVPRLCQWQSPAGNKTRMPTHILQMLR